MSALTTSIYCESSTREPMVSVAAAVRKPVPQRATVGESGLTVLDARSTTPGGWMPEPLC